MDVRRRLVGLLDYVEQVVRLDERVAFRLSEYRLLDSSTFAISKTDTENLPGVRHDIRDDEGQIWLEVERLARKESPAPPQGIAEWVASLTNNPSVIDPTLNVLVVYWRHWAEHNGLQCTQRRNPRQRHANAA